MDRYSKISDKGASIKFIDSLDTFKGWKTVFNQSDSWIAYNNVDFGKKKLNAIVVKAKCEKGGVLQIRTKGIDKTVIAEVKVPKSSDWEEVKLPLLKFDSGIQNLFLVSKEDNEIEVDWIKFEL